MPEVKILVFFFLEEGIAIQPIPKLEIQAHPTEGTLRRMDVKIDHIGKDQRIAVVIQRKRIVLFG